MSLDEIYEPIKADLEKVEEKLESIADVDISLLARLLDYSLKSVGKRIRPSLTLFSGMFYDYDLTKQKNS